MQELGERELRAYVGVTEIGISGLLLATAPVATVRIRNTGKTPAYKLSVWGGVSIMSGSEPPPEPPGPGKVLSNLEPSVELNKVTHYQSPMDQATLDALAVGSKTLYIHGEIRYRDAFGRDRRTTYRKTMRGPIGNGEAALTNCESGNDAD
jgi:hypothetical protein